MVTSWCQLQGREFRVPPWLRRISPKAHYLLSLVKVLAIALSPVHVERCARFAKKKGTGDVARSWHVFTIYKHGLDTASSVENWAYSETCSCDHLYSETTSIQGPLSHVPIVALQGIFTSIKETTSFFFGPSVVT